MVEIINNYGTIISIMIATVSLFVSVGIAIYTSRSSAKDTKRQVDSMKQICLLQLDSTYDMLEMELYKYSLNAKNDEAEIKVLRAELDSLRNSWNSNPKKMEEIRLKIEKMGRSAEYQNNFSVKIMMRQFQIVNTINAIRRS